VEWDYPEGFGAVERNKEKICFLLRASYVMGECVLSQQPKVTPAVTPVRFDFLLRKLARQLSNVVIQSCTH
jgi:hypothetical protein